MSAQCVYCDKIFSTWFNLNKHYRYVHEVKPPLKGFKKHLFNFKCLESDCNCSFKYNIDLINHLRESHNFEIESENKSFANIEEFKIWKEYIERDENCYYVAPRGKKVRSDNTQIKYYVCNRSGKFKTKIVDNNRKRKLKSQGSNKLEHSCVSQMILKIKDDNSVTMDRWKTHYGHAPEVEHLRISEQEQFAVASKLINGVPKSKILSTIRESTNNDELKRIDIISLKDIDNIKARFHIDLMNGIRHKDDAASIDLWVEDLRNCDENPVLFYKKLGDVSDTFDKDDFCLIVMTTFQKEMLTLFGNNIVYMDGSDGLNNYDFDLFSLMVIDEYGEGFPVAVMFTNRKDTYGQSIFFQCIKQTVGVISPRTFMSNLPNIFYDAWQLIMGPVEYHIYCSWYVDQAWQQNMQKITNKDKRNTVYETLKVLQYTSDIQQFHKHLDVFINDLVLDPHTKIFATYFSDNYINNYQQWAYCYCKSCGIDTDMNLESMYEVIKSLFLKRKKAKRLDKGLHMVMKFIRDKTLDRIIKNAGEDPTVDTGDIHSRHQAALTSYFIATQINSIFWTVQTEVNEYIVAKVLESKCCNLCCDFCGICVHMYTCTCIDFFIKNTICEHIHFIGAECTNDEITYHGDEKIPFELTESVISMEGVEIVDSNEPTYLKEKLKDDLLSLHAQASSINFNKLTPEILEDINGHIITIQNLLSASMLKNETMFDNNLDDVSNTDPSTMTLTQCIQENEFKQKNILKKIDNIDILDSGNVDNLHDHCYHSVAK